MGGMNFTTEVKDVAIEDPKFSKVNVSLALTLDKLGLDTGYDVDIGILNELPIYGVGKIKLGISRVRVEMNVMLNLKSDLSKKNISDLNLQIAFYDTPAEITGFWKNSRASQFLTGIINILEKLFCMWFTYEKDCGNCVLAKLIEFGINQYLDPKEVNLVVDCDCLKNNKYNLKNVLENIGNSYVHGGSEAVNKYLASEEVYNILLDLYQNISAIIVNESYRL
nr:uncharacterized protein LOC111517989 [Leptinotarsa decemlineata]